MSALLNGWKRHLSDERLFDAYLAEQCGDGMDPRTADHLVDCHACQLRYDDVAGFMSGIRDTAEAETDAIFTADVLHEQQQQIAQRLAAMGHAGRVLSFPGTIEAIREPALSRPTGSRVAAGWVAAAAAAGLFVGVGSGIYYDTKIRAIDRTPASVSAPVDAATPAQAAAPTPVSTPDSSISLPDWMSEDDAAELEASLDRPRTPELVAFDLITPHVREIKYRR
jgi:hypothetical protein